MGPSFEWQGHGQQCLIVIVLHSAAVESMEDEKSFTSFYLQFTSRSEIAVGYCFLSRSIDLQVRIT